jgi:undecaprenyl diphosphate synthase
MDGYLFGIRNLVNMISYAKSFGVKYVTFYAFSTENWRRPQNWIDGFMFLLKAFFKNKAELASLRSAGAHLKVIGDISRLDSDLQEILIELIKESEDNTGIFVTIAVGYGGRDEIVRAVKRLVESGREITEENLSKHLDTSPDPDPDMIIRTSGKQRLSNFLLWQSSYSELYFTDIEWPAFGQKNLEEAISEFFKRKRTYGS